MIDSLEGGDWRSVEVAALGSGTGGLSVSIVSPTLSSMQA